MSTITIEQNQQLEKILISSPEMEKKMRAIVRTVIQEARAAVMSSAKTEVHSTKAAWMAVRSAVYKRVMGGNVNILSGRSAGGKRAPLPQNPDRTGKRGGNRMERSRRTEDLLTYYGKDRGFVLRFMNDGTTQRTSRYGNRGSLAARNWFGPRSRSAFDRASESLAQRIDELVTETFNQ